MSGLSRLHLRPRPAANRERRSTPTRLLAGQLISLAGLIGRTVRLQGGLEIGRLSDVVVRWDDAAYPPVTGLVIRVGRRTTFLPASRISELRPQGVELRTAKVDLRDYERRSGEITLASDVLDHQLIDVDGVRVVRASDLYFASIGGTFRLVGVDVGFSSLLRRLGPTHYRDRPTPSRVIDWSTIQPISVPGAPVRIGRTHQALHRLRPAELAELVEDLGGAHRQAFVAALDPAVAADVLEEMSTEPLDALLSEMPLAQAAALIGEMAPDEAAEALREMDDDKRDEVFAKLSTYDQASLRKLVDYEEDTAGSVMTTVMVTVQADATVADVALLLGDRRDERGDIDGILVVDADGRLLDDVSLFELLVADREATMASLVGPPFPVTVADSVDLDEVLSCFIDSRDSSVVVIDEDDRPVGRILADDVIDALLADRRLGRRSS